MKALFLTLLLCLSAFAQDCSTVNHVTAPGSPFEKLPVADQDGTGICYAYTSAQLIDYHLLKTRQTRERVMHPVWIALKSSKKILDQGNEVEAINALRTAGSCDYGSVEGALNLFGRRARAEGAPLVAFLEAFAREMQRQTQSEKKALSEKITERAYNKALEAASPYCDEDVLWERLLPQLKGFSETSVQLFNRLLRQSCRSEGVKRYKIPEPLVAGSYVTDAQAKSTLNDQISKGPFTISYCSETWNKSSYVGMIRPSGDSKKDCGMHSSIAVGRKKIGPHCYMLIRNSWGTGWGDWNKDYKCLCRHKLTRAWVDECNSTDHNKGNHSVEACYIGMNQLSKNLQDLTTFNE